MTKRIGVHLRVTGHTSQGGRKYMEDCFSVAYQHTDDQSDLEYAYFGIFDGHGGSEAAFFAKNHLMDYIVSQNGFWSENDDDVLEAIREGFLKTHNKMWMIQDEWPKTASGLPSTAGTTASIAFVRHGKIYTGHVGDSGIILGYQEDEEKPWLAMALTEDHKPESLAEKTRIENNGGKVVIKSGVPRVVWNKPRVGEGHKGPVRRNTPVDEIPFLAVARSLGDLWSYNAENNVFVVSPEPDVAVKRIDVNKFRCLLFGTDGLWNMLTPQQAVTLVQQAEANNKSPHGKREWINPSKRLVEEALLRWSSTRMRADNTTVVSLMLDPPGMPKKASPNRILPASSPNSTVKLEKDSVVSNEINDCILNRNEVPENETENLVEDVSEVDENLTPKVEQVRCSTPFENIDEHNASEECNENNAVRTEQENMPANNNSSFVTCMDDDEEMNDDYNAFQMNFNAEHINNVIFGELTKTCILPETDVAEEHDTNSSSINNEQNLLDNDGACEDTEDINTENINTENINDISSVVTTDDFEENIEVSSEDIKKADAIDNNDDESESIQIHEISSSVSQEPVEEISNIMTRAHKLRKRSAEIECQHKTKKNKITSSASRASLRRNGKKQGDIKDKPVQQVTTINKHASVNASVKKLFGKKYWYPIVSLESSDLEALAASILCEGKKRTGATLPARKNKLKKKSRGKYMKFVKSKAKSNLKKK